MPHLTVYLLLTCIIHTNIRGKSEEKKVEKSTLIRGYLVRFYSTQLDCNRLVAVQ